MRVALIAEESAGVQALRLLLDRGDDVVVIFAAGEGRSRAAGVAAAAARSGLGVRPPAEVTRPAGAKALRDAGVELLLNVHGLHLVHRDVLAAAPIGAFNLHPGPLLRYAGLNAPSWAVANEEDAHAVTLHHMVPELDAGSVAYEAEFPLAPGATGLSVSLDCVRHGVPLIGRLLEDAGAGSIPARVQDLAQRRVFGRAQRPFRGRVPWHESAARIDAFVRACDYGPFPSPWEWPSTRYGDRHLRLVRTGLAGAEAAAAPPGTVLGAQDGAAIVATGDGHLRVERVESDRGVVDAADILEAGARFA